MSKKKAGNGDITITGETLAARRAEIRRIYTTLSLPLMIMSSGGKDSCAALQLIWESIAELPVADRTRPLFVLMGDTGTSEMPQIRSRIHRTARLITAAAQAQAMPISVHIAQPAIAESFWPLLIGRGYAAPTVRFRWCQNRLKIRPLTRLSKALAAQHGGRVIQALGTRRSESDTRAASFKRHEIPGWHFPFHHNAEMPGSYIYAPIRDWTTADVWLYLSQCHSPLHPLYNLELRALYKDASEKHECPVILDPSQPSCGTSRFGCWTCTVPKINGSLMALADSPDGDWLWPMVDLYEFLKLTTDPAKKHLYRAPKLKADGTVKMLSRDPHAPTPGKYTLATRQLILEMLLAAQVACRQDGPDSALTLITEDELRAIRWLWLIFQAEQQIRAASATPVTQATLDRQIPAMLERWYAQPEDAPPDTVRAMVQRLLGEDLGPWSMDDVVLLEQPRPERTPSPSEQIVWNLFGEEAM